MNFVISGIGFWLPKMLRNSYGQSDFASGYGKQNAAYSSYTHFTEKASTPFTPYSGGLLCVHTTSNSRFHLDSLSRQNDRHTHSLTRHHIL